ncbi:aspartate ammonia-lyase [Alistipes sp. CAG:268]|jgi:aspartate ammonia-lyase|uniref:aspartate ammonia-lyase n=1 Tax=Alistipes sp. CAG:268 TaxID=1262693 RepID=UPI0003399D7B|nr:aspartate ammonia-lyase [Alistipes sp. CAG:268]CDC98310.1 aspartate ammonia-lyase [Alistipes sp. CAG:268]HBW02208.1 aspartate ammonia-lyase [Alistipes sp.]HIX96049.1 aspartate ammonia-lyase [Candidatus Alistipes avistercoris]
MDFTEIKLSGKTRREHDLLGEMEIPEEYYFGVQTMRAVENFHISRVRLNFFPRLIHALADVKQGAAAANRDLGLLDPAIADAITRACEELREDRFNEQFVVDMVQGGAGTSTNMNANEVIANRALELLGHHKGEYSYCHPNNHVNLSQSTNDAYPTAVRIALARSIDSAVTSLQELIAAFHAKGEEFADIIKMGRTQLQDAVPMTLGQEFEAYAATLTEEIDRLKTNMRLFYEINMGATAIGTGINADPDYAELCTKHLREITGLPLTKAANMIEATSDTGAFIMNSSALKRLAVKLSKICNDLRLLSSGPRCGLNEINLPPRQPGSSIMPGKVNPVIPEVVNQVAFRVIGNDLAITLASEAGQLELNVMEPIIVLSLFENIEMLVNAMNTLREKCIVGITANPEVCRRMVYNSIGLVTALNPYLGYETSTMLAKEALQSGKGIYDLVLEHKLMDEEELNKILRPENMVHPRKKITE